MVSVLISWVSRVLPPAGSLPMDICLAPSGVMEAISAVCCCVMVAICSSMVVSSSKSCDVTVDVDDEEGSFDVICASLLLTLLIELGADSISVVLLAGVDCHGLGGVIDPDDCVFWLFCEVGMVESLVFISVLWLGMELSVAK